MITDKSVEQREKYRTDMGLQAYVEFDGTDFDDTFDEALNTLRTFAQRGEGRTNWIFDKNKYPQSKYGYYNTAVVEDREYEVIEETSPENNIPSVSIRGVNVREG